jgi:hypothetical protein
MVSMRDVLLKWLDTEVTVVNPQSFAETMLKEVIRMETYRAKIVELGSDYVRLSFTAPKKNEPQPVDQVIPFHEIKRISQWGDERILHL